MSVWALSRFYLSFWLFAFIVCGIDICGYGTIWLFGGGGNTIYIRYVSVNLLVVCAFGLFLWGFWLFLLVFLSFLFFLLVYFCWSFFWFILFFDVFGEDLFGLHWVSFPGVLLLLLWSSVMVCWCGIFCCIVGLWW